MPLADGRCLEVNAGALGQITCRESKLPAEEKCSRKKKICPLMTPLMMP